MPDTGPSPTDTRLRRFIFPALVFSATVAAEYFLGLMFLQVEPAGGPHGSMTAQLSQIAYCVASFLTIGLSFVILTAGKTSAGTITGLGMILIIAAAIFFLVL